MKDNKKIIIVTIIIATILSIIVGFITYKITINNKTNQNYSVISSSKSSKYLKIGKYTLQYGIYKGYNIEYGWDDESQKKIETSKKEIILKLNPDNTYELSGEKHKFSVVKKDIIVPDFNNNIMMNVIGNNKIMLQVGSGIEMTFSK